MLTIKQVKQGGSETILEIKDVKYEAEEQNGWKNRKLYLTLSDGSTLVKANHGTFFVMNEKGHTISKYHLGPDEEVLESLLKL